MTEFNSLRLLEKTRSLIHVKLRKIEKKEYKVKEMKAPILGINSQSCPQKIQFKIKLSYYPISFQKDQNHKVLTLL